MLNGCFVGCSSLLHTLPGNLCPLTPRARVETVKSQRHYSVSCYTISLAGNSVRAFEKFVVLILIKMLQTTLTFFRQKSANKILLAMKKRGFGIGKWNGTY